jgi:integrase
MGTLVKDARDRSPFWYCAYTTADGRRLKKSTKETDRRKAKIVCEGYEAAEDSVKHGTATEEQVRRIMNDVIARVTGKRVYDPTVRQWFERWLDSEKGALSDSTLTRYRQIVRDFLSCIGPVANRRLESVTSEDVLKYREQLESGGRAPLTVNLTIKRVLKRAFKVAMDEGLIARNPCATVRSIRDSGRVEKGTFTPEQITRLIEHAEGDWKGLILAGYYTGGRLSDLARLKWSGVDLAPSANTGSWLSFVQRKVADKSKKAKVRIPIHEQLEEYLLARPSSDSTNAPVFPELHDKPGSGKSGLSMAFKRIMERAGIDAGVIRERKGTAGRSVSALSFHSLRHSFNSALANAEVPQELRQKLTGHASAEMNTVYTHHELDTLRAAVQTIGRLPKGGTSE